MNYKSFFNHIAVKIVAAFLIFMGFGMIHGSSQLVERLGSVFIGAGALYFIVILVKSIYFTKQKNT